MISTLGEYANIRYDAYGVFLTLLGVVLSAVKGIATNLMMIGRLKLHPLELLNRLAPLALFQCLIYAYSFGEFHSLARFLFFTTDIEDDVAPQSSHERYVLLSKLFLNGFLAFALNFVSFTANKKTSALTMTVAGNCKQAFSILLAIYIFNIHITAMNGLGISITLLGGAWYR